MTNKEIIKRLERVKSFIFRNTIAKIDYLKIEKTTGEKMPFYAQIVELNEIIKELKEQESRNARPDC